MNDLSVRITRCALIGLTLAWHLADRVPAHAATETTLYISHHFEVRDHEQPVKYVHNGDTRVARVTGSLSGNPRVQRLRLHAGWNLCSLAVTASNFVSQAANAQPGVITSSFVWDQPALSWAEVSAGDTVSANSILWLHASADAIVAISGAYIDPTNRLVNTSGDFFPGAGLEAWEFKSSLSAFPSASAFTYEAGSPRWMSQLPPPLEQSSEFPDSLAPGSAVFVRADSPCELAVPDSGLRIRYYHHDHLGSSSAFTDDEGALVEETAFYPFGMVRNEFQPRQIVEPYKFTQKERDRESGLHYFEARYQAASLSRFVTPDIKYADPDTLSSEDLFSFLSTPQEINLYGYVRNNPLRFVDPTGLDAKAAQPKPKALVAYTPDMFADAAKRLGIKDEASYRAALRATYRQEAGKAQITVQRVNGTKELEALISKGGFETVIINSHAYLNKRALIIGNDDLTPDDLEQMSGGGKKAPKRFFFYGCNSAKTGFAGDVAGRLPNSEVTGSTDEIRQTSTWDPKKKQFTIQEDRRFNKTYKKGGAEVDDARKVDVRNTPALSREDFR